MRCSKNHTSKSRQFYILFFFATPLGWQLFFWCFYVENIKSDSFYMVFLFGRCSFWTLKLPKRKGELMSSPPPARLCAGWKVIGFIRFFRPLTLKCASGSGNTRRAFLESKTKNQSWVPTAYSRMTLRACAFLTLGVILSRIYMLPRKSMKI